MGRSVPQIDKDIDAIHAEMKRCHPELRRAPRLWYGPTYLAACQRWQRAWDAEPALREREKALYCERYDATIERDKQTARETARKDRAAARTPRAKKCPTCGHAAPALYEALSVLLAEAQSFNVSGVYFDEPCMNHKGPALAIAALALARGETND